MPDRDVVPGQTVETVCPFFLLAPRLSKRQREVLSLAALGCTDREIARALTLSVHTVHEHLERVRERLEARNTTHAVAIALGAGLIQVDAFAWMLLRRAAA